MPITGPARAGDNKQDTRLRKLSLHWDRFTGNALASQAVDTPQVSRRIEAIVKPTGAFDQAIMAVGTLNLNNQNIIVDSYDSRDPLKSTNGLYESSFAARAWQHRHQRSCAQGRQCLRFR